MDAKEFKQILEQLLKVGVQHLYFDDKCAAQLRKAYLEFLEVTGPSPHRERTKKHKKENKKEEN